MRKHILIIQGHPDPKPGHFGRALAQAYREGATAAGHAVRTVDIAKLKFPLLASARDWEKGVPPAAIGRAQKDIAWASHLVIVFPLWLGSLPARVKGFFEQALRPGFALRLDASPLRAGKLGGRSARIVVTMGMPAFVYRWYFHAQGVRSLERGILNIVGIKPVRTSLVGLVEGSARRRTKWLAEMRERGRRGD